MKTLLKSNKAIYLIALLAVLLFPKITHAQSLDSSQCGIIMPGLSSGPPGVVVYHSTYGAATTPRDSLRILVIYAGFATDSSGYHGALDHDSTWSFLNLSTLKSALPVYQTNQDVFYDSFPKIATSTSLSNKFNISNYYFEMSQHSAKPFKVIGVPFPERIDIKPTSPSGQGLYVFLNHYNKYVFDSIQNRISRGIPAYANFNWRNFDHRINPHSYFTSRVDSTRPDSDIDIIVIIWRFDGNAAHDPIAGLSSEAGPVYGFDASGSYSLTLADHSKLGIGSYGYTYMKGWTSDVGETNRVIIHEFAHIMGNMPHECYSGNLTHTFYSTGGWGCTTPDDRPFSTSLGWESWLNGWINLKTDSPQLNGDIKSAADLPSGHLLKLRDFTSSSDAIRIKIPGSNQYLWLENHQGKSVFDKRHTFTQAIFPNDFKGLFGYVERYDYDRDSFAIGSNFIGSGENANKFLFGGGNYDYSRSRHSFRGPDNDTFLWHNPIYDLTHHRPNAFEGVNPITGYRDDFDDTLWGSNSLDSVIVGSFSTDNGSEERSCYRENGIFTYGRFDFGRASFQVGKIYSAFSNPAIIPTSHYYENGAGADSIPFIDTTFLHGLSVKVVSFNSTTKAYTLKIDFNNYTMSDSQRWCGRIALTNLSGDTLPDAIIGHRVHLSIDQSATNNRHRETVNTHPKKYFHNFTNPTTLLVKKNAYFLVDDTARVDVTNGSEFHLQAGAKLKINNKAILRIDATSNLITDSGAIVEVMPGGNLIIESKLYKGYGENIILHSGGKISFVNGGALVMHDNTTWNLSGAYAGSLHFESISGSAGNIISGHNTKIVMDGGTAWQAPGSAMLEIAGAGGLTPTKIPGGGSVKFDLKYVRIEMQALNGNAPPFIAFDSIKIRNSIMDTGGGSNHLHSGLHLYGQAGMNIANFVVKHALSGISAADFWGGNGLSLRNYYAAGCQLGLATNGVFVRLENCLFEDCKASWKAENMTLPSYADNTTFGGNHSGAGVYYSGSTSAYLLVKQSLIKRHEPGIQQIISPLVSKCNLIENSNSSGIVLDKSLLYSGSNTSFSNIGLTYFDSVQNDVLLNHSPGLFVSYGDNKFYAYRLHLSGALNTTSTSPFLRGINAYDNDWYNATTHKYIPRNNVYVWLTPTLRATIPVLTNSIPGTFFGPTILDCRSTLGSGYGYENDTFSITNSYPIKGYHNYILPSGGFSGSNLHDALSISFKDLRDSSNDFAAETNNLADIITNYNFSGENGPDSILVNAAYHAMMMSFGLGVSTSEIMLKDSLGEPSSTFTAVLGVQDTLLNRLPDTLAFYNQRFEYTIDKANMYCLAGNRNTGISIFQTALPWANLKDQQLLNYLICLNQKEQSVIDSIYTPEQADSVYSCTLVPRIIHHAVGISREKAGYSISICSGDSLALMDINGFTPGYSFQWLKDGISIGPGDSIPQILVNTTSSAVTYTFQCIATDPTNTYTDTSTMTVTVNPLPAACACTDQTVCAGTLVALGCSPVSGNIYGWVSSPSGFSAGMSMVSVNPMVTTTYSLTVTDTTTGCSNFNSAVITVTPISELDPITGTGDVCVGDTIVAFDDTPGGFWTSSSVDIATVGSTTGYVAGISSGTANISYTVNSTGCAASSTYIVNVHALPNACVGPDQFIAYGSTVSIGCTPVSGNSYFWYSNPSGPTYTAAEIGVAPTADVTTYYLTETTPYGCSKSDSVVITLGGSDAPMMPDTSKHKNTSQSNIPDSVMVRAGLYLLDIFPNPFTDNTTLQYGLSKTAHVTISIYDMLGRFVATLKDATIEAGNYSYLIEPDTYGLVQGIYQVKIYINDNLTVRRIIRLK